MPSPMEQLFQVALGLAQPWVVSKIEFSEAEHRLDLWLDFPAGSKFPCPQCQAGCGVHDTHERTWRQLNFFEHRLFSFITQDWRGRPLVSVQTIVNLITSTTTTTGLVVKAALDTKSYPTKVKVTDRQLEQLRLTPLPSTVNGTIG